MLLFCIIITPRCGADGAADSGSGRTREMHLIHTLTHTPARVGQGGGKGSEEEKQQQIAAGTDAAASIFDEWVSCYRKYFINTNGTMLL